MVRILAGLAERSPQWELLIKPRIAPGQATFHDVETHISSTVRWWRKGVWASNWLRRS